MATMYVSAQPFVLRSTWVNKWENGYYLKSTTPSTAKAAQLFATSAIPAGSTVQSAILKIEKVVSIGGGTFTADGVANANQVDVTNRLTPNADGSFNDIDISFTFKAYGETGADKPKGTRTVACNVKSVTIEITYNAGSGAVYDAEAYRMAALAEVRKIKPRGVIAYPDGSTQPITENDIVSFQINEGTDDGVLLGTATSARLELGLVNADGEWLQGGGMRVYRELMGAKITLEIGLEVNGEWVYTPAGMYVLDEMNGDEGTPVLNVGGYDEMANAMQAKFDDTLKYPATLSEVLAHIVEKSGYSVTGALVANRVTMIPSKPDWGKECTLRQALAFVCGAGACYAAMTRDGFLAIHPTWKTTPTLELDTSNYLTIAHDERKFTFNRLSVTPRGANSENDAIKYAINSDLEELPSNTLYIDDNPLFVKKQSIAQGMVNEVAQALQGATWRALDTTWRGDPSVTIGTRIGIIDRRGQRRETTIMEQEIGWNGGFYMTAACGIDTKEISTGALTGAGMIDTKKVAVESIGGELLAELAVTANKLANLAVTMEKIADSAITTEKLADGSVSKIKVANAAIGSAQIEDAAITNAKIATLAVGSANIQDLAVTTAKIAQAAIDSAHIKDAAITNAKIGTAEIDTAKIALGAITQALIAQGAVGTAQIANGSITDAKIVELTANKINAGTLSVERLVVVGNDKSIVFAINEANGTAQLSQTTIDGGSLTQRSITADRIVAGSITSAEIAAETITANNILAGAITTEKLKAMCVTADKIASDVGKSLDLSSNESVKASVVSGVENSAMTLTKDEFTLAFDGKNVMEVDEDSAVFDVDTLTATGQIIGNVVNTQKAGSYTVKSGASIQSAINNLGKYLLGNVYVYVEGQHTEDVSIQGFYGIGNLYLSFRSGAVFSGSIDIRYCKSVSIIGPSQSERCFLSTAENGIYSYNVERLNVYLLNMYGGGRQRGIYCLYTPGVYIEECALAGFTQGIYITSNSQASVYNCIGGGTGGNALTSAAVVNGGAMMTLYGSTRPMGALSDSNGAGLLRDAGTVETSATGDTPVVNTSITAVPSVTYSCVSSTAAGNSTLVHDWGYYTNPFQGKYSAAGGYMHGIWLYADGLSAVRSAISGKTIVSATLTIKRADAYGTDGKTMRLWYHDKTAKPSGSWPSAILTDTGLTATIDRGKTVTFELTSALVDKIKSGAIKGFGVSSISNKDLMQFDAAVCDLTIIYK